MERPSRKRKRICRLCWIKCECEHFEFLGKITKDYMDMLLLNINLVIIRQEPVICTNCKDKVKKCFDFKSMCLDIQDYIIQFVNDGCSAKLDLKDVCLSQRQNNLCIPDDHDICAFCMGLVKSSSSIYLDIEGDNLRQKRVLEKCLPELDLTIIKKPVICALCHGSLEDYYLVLTNSLILGEKIKKYCEIQMVYNEADLFSVLQSTLSNKPVDIIDERKSSMNRENIDELVKVKNEKFMEIGDHQKLDNVLCMPTDVVCCEEQDTKVDTIKTEGEFYVQQTKEVTQKNESFIETEDQKCLINEDTKVKTEQDFDSFQDGVEPCSKVSTHNVPECKILEKHDLTEKDYPVHQYDASSFQTTYKRCLKRSSLMHNKSSKTTMCMCSLCLFRIKYKTNLKMHPSRHKDSSEMCHMSTFIVKQNRRERDYRCDLCPFQVNGKSLLAAHMASHKNPFHLTYLS